MAAPKNAAAHEFTKMIEAGQNFKYCHVKSARLTLIDRKKNKAQALANTMLGSGRRSGAPAKASISGRTGQGATLASRVGVTKVSDGTWDF